MNEQTFLEFLKILPRKEYSDFYREDCYIIPCRVLEFGEDATHNSIWVTIEHLNFVTGEPVIRKATCYKKSLQFLKDENLPFENECTIYQKEKGLNFLIYGRFYPQTFVDWWGIYEGKTEAEILQIFKENYKDLNAWIKEPAKHS